MLEDFGKAAIEFYFSQREYYDMVEYHVNTYPGNRKFFTKATIAFSSGMGQPRF